MGSSKTSFWHSIEDLDNDLCEFSEIAVSQDDICEPPLATIVQYRAQMSANHNSSVFDTHMPYEDVTYVSSGRGRGGFSKFYRPGIPVNDSDQEAMVYRKIREVSGIGYSNEVIKNSMRAKLGKMSEREFSDVPSSCEETSRTNGCTERTTANSTTNTRSTTPSYQTPGESASLFSAANSNETEIKELPPPPLSVMLKRARETKRNISPKVEVQAVADSYAKMALEPPKVGHQSNTSPKIERRRDSPNIDEGSNSESSQFSAKNSSGTPTSETSYNTAGSGVENLWYNKPSQLKEMSSSSSGSSSNGDEPLSWRKKKQGGGKIYTREWRKAYSKKDDFNINSKKDFPEL